MACLDTTVFVDWRRKTRTSRHEAAISIIEQLIASRETLVTTRFNVAELYVGAELSSDPLNERKAVDSAPAGIEILEFDEAPAHNFARLQSHLIKIGKPAGDMDVLIAAVALTHAHPLVTRNARHFI